MVGHHREVREENFLLLFRAERFVLQHDLRLERCGVRTHVLLCVKLIKERLSKLVALEVQVKLLLAVVTDGRKLLEDFVDAFFDEPTERRELRLYEVRQIRVRFAVSAECLLLLRVGGHKVRRLIKNE